MRGEEVDEDLSNFFHELFFRDLSSIGKIAIRFLSSLPYQQLEQNLTPLSA